MRGRVPEEKVAEVKRVLRENGWKITHKPDVIRWPTWWLRLLQTLVGLVGFFRPSAEKDFYFRYSQGLYGHILLHYSEGEFDLRDPGMYAVVRHEIVHLRDQQKHPILFALTYVIPPALVTVRAWWELRGYAQNMIVEYEMEGRVSDDTLTRIHRAFTGLSYLWMMVLGGVVRKRLETLRGKIESGEVSGTYPDIGLTA